MSENWPENQRYTICSADNPYSRRWNCTFGIPGDEIDNHIRKIQGKDKEVLIHKFDAKKNIEEIRKILARDYQPYISMKNY